MNAHLALSKFIYNLVTEGYKTEKNANQKNRNNDKKRRMRGKQWN